MAASTMTPASPKMISGILADSTRTVMVNMAAIATMKPPVVNVEPRPLGDELDVYVRVFDSFRYLD